MYSPRATKPEKTAYRLSTLRACHQTREGDIFRAVVAPRKVERRLERSLDQIESSPRVVGEWSSSCKKSSRLAETVFHSPAAIGYGFIGIVNVISERPLLRNETKESGVLSTTGPPGLAAAAAEAAGFATAAGGGAAAGEAVLSGVGTSPDWLSTFCEPSVNWNMRAPNDC